LQSPSPPAVGDSDKFKGYITLIQVFQLACEDQLGQIVWYGRGCVAWISPVHQLSDQIKDFPDLQAYGTTLRRQTNLSARSVLSAFVIARFLKHHP
jgi:phenylalanine-4-hydroxylase